MFLSFVLKKQNVFKNVLNYCKSIFRGKVSDVTSWKDTLQNDNYRLAVVHLHQAVKLQFIIMFVQTHIVFVVENFEGIYPEF